MKYLRDLPFVNDAAITAHSAAHEPFQQGLPKLYTDHQPEK